ncbi:hypothetical protein [Paenibacillus tianjinensis]|uniref:Uncharacterized protein n=1 Tax=Paenibacillus tianjinensis TaxID=2810347 RepID=A0ABX7L674_9BACL|nr:hypothetical protein [Paenibacillus tianjinensis]QSF43479.1 hypothetical protein JRJ22_19640 [Paenibacillus tianjinensis]
MKDTILKAFSNVNKTKYEVENANKKFEEAQDVLREAKVSECIDNIINVIKDEGKITDRDLRLFIGSLGLDIKQIYFK